MHWLYVFVVYGHWPRYNFSDTRFMLTNCKKGNNKSDVFTEDIIEIIRRCLVLLSISLHNLTVVLDVLTYEHNISTLSENIKFIWARCKTEHKSSSKARFYTCLILVSKDRTNGISLFPTVYVYCLDIHFPIWNKNFLILRFSTI